MFLREIDTYRGIDTYCVATHVYKRIHGDDNVAKFKNSLSSVNWSEILNGVDANSDYDNFIKKFTEVYDECIPLKKIQNQ